MTTAVWREPRSHKLGTRAAFHTGDRFFIAISLCGRENTSTSGTRSRSCSINTAVLVGCSCCSLSARARQVPVLVGCSCSLVGPVIHRVAAFSGSVLCQDEDQVRG